MISKAALKLLFNFNHLYPLSQQSFHSSHQSNQYYNNPTGGPRNSSYHHFGGPDQQPHSSRIPQQQQHGASYHAPSFNNSSGGGGNVGNHGFRYQQRSNQPGQMISDPEYVAGCNCLQCRQVIQGRHA